MELNNTAAGQKVNESLTVKYRLASIPAQRAVSSVAFAISLAISSILITFLRLTPSESASVE